MKHFSRNKVLFLLDLPVNPGEVNSLALRFKLKDAKQLQLLLYKRTGAL